MATIMEALGGNPGDTIMDALGGQSGETISEALGGSKGETIVEAKGGLPGETIMEAFGGRSGDTIANIIAERDNAEVWFIEDTEQERQSQSGQTGVYLKKAIEKADPEDILENYSLYTIYLNGVELPYVEAVDNVDVTFADADVTQGSPTMGFVINNADEELAIVALFIGDLAPESVEVSVLVKETTNQESNTESEPVVKYTVTYNANGGTGTIEPVEVVAGESITLDDGSGLTAPEGKGFLGWAKTSSAQSATVESPFTPDKDTVLYAVWVEVTINS